MGGDRKVTERPYRVYALGGGGQQVVTSVAEAAAVVRSIALATGEKVVVDRNTLGVPRALFNREEGRWTCQGSMEWAEKIVTILHRHG